MSPIMFIAFISMVLGYGVGRLLAQNKIRHLTELAFRDSITGLYNARKLQSYLSSDNYGNLKKYTSIAYIIIDLDNFSEINSNNGFGVGDQILRRFSDCILTVLEKGASVFRFKLGDEFVILIPGGEIQNINDCIKKLAQTCVPIEFSFGYAILTTDNCIFDDEIERAEEMLFVMKKEKKLIGN
jgi:diguanylate cyclase (GGDEF)-like protein